MTQIRLEDMSLADGRVTARLSGAFAGGRCELFCQGEGLGSVELPTGPQDGFEVAFDLPRSVFRDGAVLLELRGPDQALLGQHLLMAGPAVAGDAAAEIAVLKAELQALKRAFLAEAADPKLRAADRALIVAEAVETALSGPVDRV